MNTSRTNVSVVDVASGEIKALAATAAAEFQPLYSPDGEWIALHISDSHPTWGIQFRIHIIPAGRSGRPDVLLGQCQRNVAGSRALRQ
jgi:hypothetical protein